MSTPHDELTQEQADARADELLEMWSRAVTLKDRKAIQAEINQIIRFCSPSMKDRLWEEANPGKHC